MGKTPTYLVTRGVGRDASCVRVKERPTGKKFTALNGWVSPARMGGGAAGVAGLGARRPADGWVPTRDNASATSRSPAASPVPWASHPWDLCVSQPPKVRCAQLCNPPKKCPNQLERKSLPSDRSPAPNTQAPGAATRSRCGPAAQRRVLEHTHAPFNAHAVKSTH